MGADRAALVPLLTTIGVHEHGRPVRVEHWTGTISSRVYNIQFNQAASGGLAGLVLRQGPRSARTWFVRAFGSGPHRERREHLGRQVKGVGSPHFLLPRRWAGRTAHGQVVQHPPTRQDGSEKTGTVVAGPASRHHQQTAPSPPRAVDQTVHPSPSTARRRRGIPEDAEGVRDTCRRSSVQLPDRVSELREFEDVGENQTGRG